MHRKSQATSTSPPAVARGLMALALLFGANACDLRDQSAKARDATSPAPNKSSAEPQASPVAVEFASGKQLTLAEIERPIAQSIYEMRTNAAQDRALTLLVQLEAERRGVTPEQFVDQETDGRLPPKTDAELHGIYDEMLEERRELSPADLAQVEPLPSFEEFAKYARQKASPTQRRMLEQALYERLMEASGMRLKLDVLGRPKPMVAEGGPALGPRDAVVTIYEYTDFAAQYSASVQPALEKLLEKYPRQLRIVFRQYPSAEHPQAHKAAEAALCAHEQGQYWSYRKQLFARKPALDEQALRTYAAELGLDVRRFETCLTSGATREAVERDIAEARRNGLGGMPVFLVNGTPLSGAADLKSFERLIDFDLPAR